VGVVARDAVPGIHRRGGKHRGVPERDLAAAAVVTVMCAEEEAVAE
jgi:hypothetical protein